MHRKRPFLSSALIAAMAVCGKPVAASTPSSPRADAVIAREATLLKAELAPLGLRLGAQVHIAIFKEERRLEVWLGEAAQTFRLFKSYPICAYSGSLGPKLREGDLQAPEGFYSVRPRQLNPMSRYHLAFNLGFPNAYDRAQGRTGTHLMVHGSCVSIGCYAMTDAVIEEIYTLMAAAFAAGQDSITVHAFPFRMTDRNMERHRESEWRDFWLELKPAYDAFAVEGRVPRIRVVGGRYRVEGRAELRPGAACVPRAHCR